VIMPAAQRTPALEHPPLDRARTRLGSTPESARSGTVGAMLSLQRSAGNRATASLMRTRASIPLLPGGSATRPLPSLTPAPVGPDGNASAAPTPSAIRRAGPALTTFFELAEMAQRLERADHTSQPDRGIPAAAAGAVAALGAGEPIPAGTRADFELAYGHRLDPVRLHTGPTAARAAGALGAQAVTLGDHVLLGAGTDLSSEAGRFVLGHELAHVVQSRRTSTTRSGRISDPYQASEREATAAALAALGGRATDLREAASDDPQAVVWWVLVLIGLGLGVAIGAGAAATGHGVDENRERRVRENRGPAGDVIAWIPIAGSIQDIWQAESGLQLALGIGFLAFDVATLGGTGMVVRALTRVPRAALRVFERGAEQAAEQGAERAAIRVAGEQVTNDAVEQAVRQFAPRGGVVATAATATEEIAGALGREGAIVFAMEGGHAVMYANRAGQIVKVHGGPLMVRFAIRELGHDAAGVAHGAVSGSATREGAVTAYAIVNEGAPLTLEALERLPTGLAGVTEAVGRAVFGSPTGCGILQGAAMEASGLSAEGIARLLPAGGASGRYFPVTLADHWLQTGAGRIVEGGAARLVYGASGTVPQATLAFVQVAGRVASSTVPRNLLDLSTTPPPQAPRSAGAAPDGGMASALAGMDAGVPADGAAPDIERAVQMERAALQIVERWGRTPDEAAIREIRQQLPTIISGWWVMSPGWQAGLRPFLRSAGMEPAAVAAILGG
jgi:hypothetical protein